MVHVRLAGSVGSEMQWLLQASGLVVLLHAELGLVGWRYGHGLGLGVP